jgi:hypothetical protein
MLMALHVAGDDRPVEHIQGWSRTGRSPPPPDGFCESLSRRNLVEVEPREIPDDIRQIVLGARDDLGEAGDVPQSLGHEMAMFGQMAAKRVGQLRALPDQHFPGAEQHGARLLIGGFDGDRPHRRPLRRLDNASASAASFF